MLHSSLAVTICAQNQPQPLPKVGAEISAVRPVKQAQKLPSHVYQAALVYQLAGVRIASRTGQNKLTRRCVMESTHAINRGTVNGVCLSGSGRPIIFSRQGAADQQSGAGHVPAESSYP
jgi:hypothetical protein